MPVGLLHGVTCHATNRWLPAAQVAPDEEAALAAALARPAAIDALLLFPDAHPTPANGSGSSSNTDAALTGHSSSSGPDAVGHQSAALHSAGDGDGARASVGGDDQPTLSRALLRYSLHMNHTAVPPTRFLLDLFDVMPSRTNGLSMYRR